MLRILFWLLSVLSLILVIKVGKIILFDFDRLTEWGMGYFTGLIILLLVSFTGAIWTGKRTYFK